MVRTQPRHALSNPPPVGTLHVVSRNVAGYGHDSPMPDEVLLPGLVVIEHSFEVPLDHGDDAGERITVFARELADPDGRDRPFLVYFQGGPGFEAPRPTRKPNGPGWLDRALRDFRVLMLDQRGTGRSTPVGTLRRPDRGAAGRLSGALPSRLDRPRRRVDPPRAGRRALERARPELRRHVRDHVPVAGAGRSGGGIRDRRHPALGPRIDEIYARTYERVLERNRRYYDRYPGRP